MSTTLLTPTAEDLRRERDSLVAEIAFDETELRVRAERFLVTANESRILRRLDEIDFLLCVE